MKRNLKVMALGVAAAVAIRAWLRHSRYLELRGKVVFITGGSRGLGLEIAREFIRRGAKVAVCARDQEELDRARKEFEEAGTSILTLKCDVGVRAEIQHAITAAEEQLGAVDVLVNNAGTIVVGPVENQDLQIFEEALQTNFWGALYATAVVIDGMKQRGGGRIVNIASVGGKVAFPHLLAYTASKFALVGYSQGLRAELAKDHILVTTVCPGLMRTGSPRNAVFTGQNEKEYTWFTLSDSLPGTSISVRRAARQIVNACVYGKSEVHLGVPAKLASILQGVAPGLSAELLSQVNKLMPEPGEVNSNPVSGANSETPFTQSDLTQLTRAAEQTQNQL